MARIYNFKEHQVRVDDTDNNQPWFLAKDVCDILGYANSRDAVRKHLKQKHVNTVAIRDGNRGNPNKTVINESGVYRLVMRSDMPHAEEFQDWVTEEVLPEIRKTGAYVHATEGESDEEILARGMLAAGRAIDRLKAQVEELQPQADKFLRYMDADGLTNLQNIGRVLGVKPNRMIELLRRMPS